MKNLTEVKQASSKQLNEVATMRGTLAHSNGCTVEWGSCAAISENPVEAFGQPSSTPHQCLGGFRHKMHLHICIRCKVLGAIMVPSKFSKAGRYYQAQVDLALKKARNKKHITVSKEHGVVVNA